MIFVVPYVVDIVVEYNIVEEYIGAMIGWDWSKFSSLLGSLKKC